MFEQPPINPSDKKQNSPEQWLGEFSPEEMEASEEVSEIKPLIKEETGPKIKGDALFLKNNIESLLKGYIKDLNDVDWLKTIGEERKNIFISSIADEYLDGWLLKKEPDETNKIIKELRNSLSPVGKEIFEEALGKTAYSDELVGNW